MSARARNTKKGRGGAQFVMLGEWLQKSEAWATMRPGPRALYVELRRRFTGTNNGDIFLSQRDAAKALNVSKDTANAYFRDLAARRFIEVTQGGHLGPSRIGQAAKWALTEEHLNGRPPSKGFMAWRENKTPS